MYIAKNTLSSLVYATIQHKIYVKLGVPKLYS